MLYSQERVVTLKNVSENGPVEQQQSRIRFPLRLKLLGGVVALLGFVIAFLIFSTIHLIKNDKRAYIYQVQMLEGSIVKEQLEQSVQTAKSMATLGTGLSQWFQSQSNLDAIFKFRLDPTTNQLQTILQQQRDGFPSEFVFSPQWASTLQVELKKDGWAFANLSGPGNRALLGVVHMPVGQTQELWVAVVSLQKFVKELRETQISVTDGAGRVLIDSDPAVMFSQTSLAQDPLFQSATSSQVSAGALEYQAQEDWLGSYHRTKDGLIIMTKTRWADAMRGTRALVIQFLLLGTSAIGFAIIMALLFARSLSRPLSSLFNATQQIGAGHFEINVKRTTGDEIGALADAFNAMSKKIQELILESMERVRLQGELAIASAVQQNLIPAPEFKNDQLSIHSHYASASECGGDWWGFFNVGNKTAILIADATGHGLPSALITATARSCFSVIHKLAQEDPGFVLAPAQLLQYANRAIYESAGGKIMMTFFAACIDHQTNLITYANAGHNPPWLFQAPPKGQTAPIKPSMKSLTAKGTRLGEVLDAAPFEEQTLPFGDQDQLFLYTDGLTEGKDGDGKMFGKKTVLKLVEANLSNGPEAVIQALMNSFKAHNGSKPLDDDITIAMARFNAS